MTTLVQARSQFFTDWVVGERHLRTPFVLVDVGCKDGIHARFRPLLPVLSAHGFDPIEEEIAALSAAEPHPSIRYHAVALGDRDGKRDFHVNRNRAQSSFYFPGQQDELARLRNVEGDAFEGIRSVPERRLDSLIADGVVPPPDYVKMDVEGHEPAVIAGARDALAHALAVETESGFTADQGQPDCHFATVSRPLNELGLRFHTFGHWYSTKACLAPGFLNPENGRLVLRPLGRIQGIDALFARDLVADWTADGPPARPGQPVSDTIVKACMLYELYNLNDCAVELMSRARDDSRLRGQLPFSPDEAIDRLMPAANGARVDMATYRRFLDLRAGGVEPGFTVDADNHLKLV